MASSGRGPAAILALYELLYVYEGQVCRQSQRPGLTHANAAPETIGCHILRLSGY